jgi:predicted transcriptional regulator
MTEGDRVLAVLRDRPRDARAIVRALDRPTTGANVRSMRVVLNRLMRAGKVTRIYNDKARAYIWHLA